MSLKRHLARRLKGKIMDRRKKLFYATLVLLALNGCGSEGNTCKDKCAQQNEHSLKYCKDQAETQSSDFKNTQEDKDKVIHMLCVKPHKQALEACHMACN